MRSFFLSLPSSRMLAACEPDLLEKHVDVSILGGCCEDVLLSIGECRCEDAALLLTLQIGGIFEEHTHLRSSLLLLLLLPLGRWNAR